MLYLERPFIINMITVTHHSPKRAILFSDLHYSHETEDVCFRVLDFIYEQAQENAAKIYFLGDFWDHVYRRGTLPVDLLNKMIRYFKTKWYIRTVMIPGNHDWYDSSETEHGLEAFQGINNITVLNKITEEDQQLFMPYCKDLTKIERAIQQTNAKVAFGHLDIVGAKMNNTRVSTKGLKHSIFDIPVYTGHYHTPSRHGKVHYIGSPYQVHLGEAGNEKSLKIIDLYTGDVFKEIPIDIGRRHFKVKSVEDISLYREGDRVVVDGEVVESVKREMERKGILVEVRKPAIRGTLRLQEDPTNPLVYWQKYCGIKDVKRDVMDIFASEVYKQAHQQNKLLKEPLDVCIEGMEISNFGPFRGQHSIEFQKGVALVTGRYKDKEGTDSNGVGKSLYTAGAFLWGCTGKTDPRFGSSGSITSGIVSHEEALCSVIIHGTVNGKSFKIDRSMSAKAHHLKFTVADSDSGNNTIRMTQRRINHRIFGVDDDLFHYLSRTVVLTQRSTMQFLDASDKKAKEEISHLVDMDLWQEMLALCKSHLKDAEKANTKYHTEMAVEKARLEEYKDLQRKNKRNMVQWEQSKVERLKQLEDQMNTIDVGDKPDLDTESMQAISLEMVQCRTKIIEAERKEAIDPNMVRYYRKERASIESHNRQIEKKLNQLKSIGNKCDICQSEITHEQSQQRILALRSDMKSTEQLDADYETKRKEMKEKHEKETVQLIADQKARLEQLKVQMKEYESRRQLLREYEKRQRQLDDWSLMYKVKSEEVNPYKEMPDPDSQLEKISAKIDQMAKRIHLLSLLKHHLGTSGIQTYLVETAIRKISERISYLCGISFDIGHSDNERLIKTVDGHPLGLMSGGEYQRVQIASFLAYRSLLQEMTSVKCNLMIFDEPDTYVDASGVKAMMQMIAENTEGCTIVISHTNSMHRDMTLFDHHIEIERDGKGSRKRKKL